MKKIILILFILFSFSRAQVVSETFSDFTFGEDANTMAHWVFDSLYRSVVSSDSLHEDLGDSTNDLTYSWVSYSNMVDSCTGSSPVYSGGRCLLFDYVNTTHYDSLIIATADAGDFQLNTGSFTIEAWIKTSQTSRGQYAAWGEGTQDDGAWLYNKVDAKLEFDLSVRAGPNSSTSVNDGNWHYCAAVHDNGTGKIYLFMNGIADGDTATINPTITGGPFIIGADLPSGANPDWGYDGYIGEMRFSDAAKTLGDIRNSFALANGWYAKADKVTRERAGTIFAFHQGFYDGDSIYYPLANNATATAYQVTVDAKGTKATDVLTCWIKGETARTQIMTTSSVNYTFNLGKCALSSDSLFFSVSAGDTIYIDNVIMSAATNIYYVDASRGSDNNAGGSMIYPWQTIAKVNGTTFYEDDYIKFRTDTLWREQLTVPSSGTSGNVITFTEYDSTGESGAKPIISGADTVHRWVDVGGNIYYNTVMATEPKIVFFDGVVGDTAASSAEVDEQDEWYWTTAGDDTLFIYTTTAADTNNIEIGQRTPNIAVTGKDYITIDNLHITKGNHASNSASLRITDGSDNVTVQNCTINNNGTNGIQVLASGALYTKHAHITTNTISNNGLVSPTAGDGCGIITYSFDATHLCDSTIIENNTFADNGVIDYGDHNIYDMGNQTIIRYNDISGAPGFGIKINTRDSINTKNIISYNLIYNNDTGGIRLEDDTGAPDSIKIYNNTFVNNNTLSPYSHFNYIYKSSASAGKRPRGNEFKNNILLEDNNSTAYGIYYGLAGYATADLDSAAMGLNTDYNLIYMTAAGSQYASRHAIANYGTMAAYISAMTNSDQNSLSSDPLMVNPTTDFTLQKTSPCIDAGVDVSLVLDYVGNTVPMNAGVDIGAYEFQLALDEAEKRYKRSNIYKRYPR